MLVNNVQSSIYSPVNLWLKWQNINKIATESIAVLTPENHHKSHTKKSTTIALMQNGEF